MPRCKWRYTGFIVPCGRWTQKTEVHREGWPGGAALIKLTAKAWLKLGHGTGQ